MAERDLALMRAAQRAHAIEQQPVPVLFRLVVTRRDEHERLGVRHESLAAAVRPLKMREQFAEPVEIGVGVAVVPNAKRHQRQHVEEVIVEHDGEHAPIGRVVLSQRGDEAQHVHRNGRVADPDGDAVPVVQRVKSFRARQAVEVLHQARELDAAGAARERVGGNGSAERRQRVGRRGARAAGVNDLVSRRSREDRRHQIAEVRERHASADYPTDESQRPCQGSANTARPCTGRFPIQTPSHQSG
jgi:hypothetical protein